MPLPINPSRFLSDLDHLRSFGAQGTGVARVAFSDTDIASRIWLAGRMTDAGLRPVVDPCGNLFGLPPGDGPSILVGSHSDTQPLGGWLDGAYGVICGLELARAALEGHGPRIAVVSFQDEEGRFGGLTGSDVWSGRLTLAEADKLTDDEGITFGAMRLRAAEIAPTANVALSQFTSFIEAHIEQGPLLEASGEVLGIVETIVGVRSLNVTFTGEANHAGTTPMHLRKDAVQGIVAYIAALNTALATVAGPATVWTCGRIVVEPNAPSIVPGTALVSVQIRDAEDGLLDVMLSRACRCATQIAETYGITAKLAEGFAMQPVPMDSQLTNRLASAANQICAGSIRRMPSGALHDAANLAGVLPTAMLFVPSIGGISHNLNENTNRADLVSGLRALAAMLGSGPINLLYDRDAA